MGSGLCGSVVGKGSGSLGPGAFCRAGGWGAPGPGAIRWRMCGDRVLRGGPGRGSVRGGDGRLPEPPEPPVAKVGEGLRRPGVHPSIPGGRGSGIARVRPVPGGAMVDCRKGVGRRGRFAWGGAGTPRGRNPGRVAGRAPGCLAVSGNVCVARWNRRGRNGGAPFRSSICSRHSTGPVLRWPGRWSRGGGSW